MKNQPLVLILYILNDSGYEIMIKIPFLENYLINLLLTIQLLWYNVMMSLH